MSRTLSDFQKEEYARFRRLLVETWGVDERRLRRLESDLKPVHKRCLSLCCAATVVSYRTRRSEHAKGIAEAAHLALVMAVKGLENPSCVLLRQIIELFLKHIYFSSHPTEYKWAQTRIDYKDLTFQFLLEYLRRTDRIRDCGQGKDFCDRIGHWYGVFSRHVHVLNVGHIGYRTTGVLYRPSSAALRRLGERTNECWPLVTLLLLMLEPERFHRASLIEQRLIRSSLPADYRQLVSAM